ncbi:MAG: chromosome condensation protein [Pirellulaceae bacterium]
MTSRLPLTTIEEFLLWEDRRAYPWSCFVRLRFSGRIEQPSLEQAIRDVMPRHPLLCAKVVTRGRREYWQAVDDPMPEIVWIDGAPGQDYPRTGHQDLRREIGVKLFVVRDENNSDLVFQIHHACADGAGMFVFANDVLIRYAQLMGVKSRRCQLPEFDVRRLEQRGGYGLSTWKFLKMLPRQMVGLSGVRQFLARSPVAVLPHETKPNDDPPPQRYPAIRTHTFTAEETAQLREAAKQNRATVNDLLTRDLFLTLGRWRASNGVEDDEAWLRMMVPFNLRSNSDRTLSAANIVSSVFLDRQSKQFQQPEALLQSIQDEMNIIKDNKLGYTFIFSLKAFSIMPNGLKNNARQDRCSSSCIFTNVGRPLIRCPLPRQDGRLVAGNVTLEGIDGTAPLRPYNCVTFSVLEYARQLTFILHYDARFVTEPQADDLTATFVARLRETLAQCDAPASESIAESPADSST